jgi:hypothetical protein
MAAQLGYPVILKAKAGGGGKGIRAVHNDVRVLQEEGAAHWTELGSQAGTTTRPEPLFMYICKKVPYCAVTALQAPAPVLHGMPPVQCAIV